MENEVNHLIAMVTIWHHIIVSLIVLTQKGFIGMLMYGLNVAVRVSLRWKMSFDGWMLDVWAVMNEQSIRPTSTYPCITKTACTEGVK